MPLYLTLLALFALRQKPTWLIDGQNLLGSRSTPRNEQEITEKLRFIRAEALYLVFDGKHDASGTHEVNGSFHHVVCCGISADDYIVEEIEKILKHNPRAKVQVVTADRELRRRVLGNCPAARKVVNPVVFWKRYLPRLAGMKRTSRWDDSDEPH